MSQIVKSLPILFDALQQTLILSALAIVFSGLLGFLIGEIAALSGRLVNWMIRRYVEFRPRHSTSGVSFPLLLSVARRRRSDGCLHDGGRLAGDLFFRLRRGDRARRHSVHSKCADPRRLGARNAPAQGGAHRRAAPSGADSAAALAQSMLHHRQVDIPRSIIGVWELTYATREIVMRTRCCRSSSSSS